MRQIRRGVFETNSSSTHSITMCMSKDYENWNNRKVYLNKYWCDSTSSYRKNKFVTKEEVIDILINSKYPPECNLNELDAEEFDEYVKEESFYTFENYGSEYYEWFSDEFTTPNGDKIVAFGYYGSDY